MHIILILITLLFFVANSTAKLLAPTNGFYQGAFMDFGPTASEVTETKIDSYQNLSGRKAVWAYFANDWIDGKIEFPKKSAQIIRDKGLVPYVRLMPWSVMVGSAKQADTIFSMQSFLNGTHDVQLRNYFQAVKDFGSPIMMEFGPEVNGDWFPWNGTWNGGSKRNGYGDPNHPDGPERFRDVLKRVISTSRAQGANNITWVFHVDSAKSPESEWNNPKYYFPGDDYIDWIGISVFGAQLPNHEWSIFQQKLKRFLPDLVALNTSRPWIVSEMAVIEDAADADRKADWLQQALQTVESGTFPSLKGITYWHSPGWLKNGSANFKIDSSYLALETFRLELRKPFWLSEAQF